MKKMIATVVIITSAFGACTFDGNDPNSKGCELVRWAVSENIASYHGDTNRWHFGIATDNSWYGISVISDEEDRCNNESA